MKDFTRFVFCPRCGGSSIAVHMKNAIKCGACGYIYFHNTAAAVAAIIEIENKILLLRRAHEPRAGSYDLPGGFVDYQESLEEALVREVREEVNIEVRDLRYFGSSPNTYRYREVTYFSADAFFLCRAVAIGPLEISEENTDFKIIRAEEIDPAIVAFPSLVKVLARYAVRSRLERP